MKVSKLQDKISDLIREETKEAEMMGEVMGQDEQYYEGIGPDPWSCAGAVIKLVRADERERCLAIAREAPRASAPDGRDLVLRTDVIRKIQHQETD